MTDLFLRCDCKDPAHNIVFNHDNEFGLEIALVSTNRYSFWGRLKHALRYVFSRNQLVEGDLNLQSEEIDELVNFLETCQEKKAIYDQKMH